MALTVQEVKNISCPDDKSQVKRSNGNSLFLLIKNDGSKAWMFRFRRTDKYQEMSLGSTPPPT